MYLFGSLFCAAAMLASVCMCRPSFASQESTLTEGPQSVTPELVRAEFYPDSARFIFDIKCSAGNPQSGTDGTFRAELPGAFCDGSVPVRPVDYADIIDFRETLHVRDGEWVPERLRSVKDDIDARTKLVRSLRSRRAVLSQTVEMLGSVRPGEKAEGLDIIKYIREAQELRSGAEEEAASLDERIEREVRELEVLKANLDSSLPDGRDRVIVVSGRVKEGVKSVLAEAGLTGAWWRPRYVLDLDSATGKIKGRMMARVRQSSGIDCLGEIEFHTKNPDENVDMPELRPHRVDVKERIASSVSRGRSNAMMSMRMSEEADMVAAEDAMPARAKMSYSAPQMSGREPPREPSVSTTLADRVFSVHGSVPSHRSGTNIALGEFELLSSTSFTIIPEVSDSAWIVAEIDRPSEYLIADASAELRVDGEPSGRMTVPEFAQEKLRLSFGHAPQITSKRTQLLESSASSWFGTSGTIAHGYKIEVTNAMDEPRVVTVLDRVPVSVNEKIKVDVKSITPEPAERGRDNLLRWELNVPAGKTAVITVEYSMSCPSGIGIAEYK